MEGFSSEKDVKDKDYLTSKNVRICIKCGSGSVIFEKTSMFCNQCQTIFPVDSSGKIMESEEILVCHKCEENISDEQQSMLYRENWYHLACWLGDDSIKTRPRSEHIEVLEVL